MLLHADVTDMILKAFFHVYNTLGTASWKRSTKTRCLSRFAAGTSLSTHKCQ